MGLKTYSLLFAAMITISLVLTSCAETVTTTPANPSPAITQTDSTVTPQPIETDASEQSLQGAVQANLTALAEAPARTPAFTATPDAITEGVEDFVQRIGLSDQTFLFLSYDDWLNLAISLLIVVVGYLIGTWLIRWFFPRLVSQTKTTFDDRLLAIIGNQLRWLPVLITLGFATNRLGFISSDLKSLLTDAYFILLIAFVFLILWRLIDLAAVEAKARSTRLSESAQGELLIKAGVWVLRAFVSVIALTWLFAHFGFNVSGIALFVALIVLVISLAARDVVADVISGVIIQIDQPFRIGDRIELQSINTSGDVVDIGIRSTHIVTVNNRMVSIPNSQIGKSQVVNYSLPDSSTKDTTNIMVAYENDTKRVQQIIYAALNQAEGVQEERGIDVRLNELTDFYINFRLEWWVKSYADTLTIRDGVNQDVIQALKDAGIVFPYEKGNLNIQMNSNEERSD